MTKPVFSSLAIVMALSWANAALAHAFPERSIPGAGATLAQVPASVSIRFDSDLEPIFSKLTVRNARGEQISQSNGAVEVSDPRVLTTRLTGSTKGIYHVYWSVVSRDGHHTEGDYTFTVQ